MRRRKVRQLKALRVELPVVLDLVAVPLGLVVQPVQVARRVVLQVVLAGLRALLVLERLQVRLARLPVLYLP